MIITYLSPAVTKQPIGGIKVLYKHAKMLAENGVDAAIYHPEKPNAVCDWFPHNVKFRTGGAINPDDDFFVVPEIWAGRYGRQFYDNRVKYAIFVQNGYSIAYGAEKDRVGELERAYQNASFVMSISDDTSEMIAFTYPDLHREKIVRLLPHVGDVFRPGLKEKVISYMPRKMPGHSQKVCFHISQHLPRDWRIVPIANQSESGVADILAKSSIFLSFCDQEGCPLPPLEAALSGAIVVGYTGQGAKEYFQTPNFRPVEYGDYRAFAREVARAIQDIDGGVLESDGFLRVISELGTRYSRQSELNHLLAFASKVRDLFPS